MYIHIYHTINIFLNEVIRYFPTVARTKFHMCSYISQNPLDALKISYICLSRAGDTGALAPDPYNS